MKKRAAGEVLPPSNILTGPAPRRSVCAPGAMLFCLKQIGRPLETLFMFSSLFRHVKWNFSHDQKRPSRCRYASPRRADWLPRLEALEDRIVPSTLTVTSAADDSSAGTLRAVLGNAQSGDTIQ